MFGIIWYFEIKNPHDDQDKIIDTFDGVDESNQKSPSLLFIGYWITAIGAVGFLLLYPGLGNWKGLMDWSSQDAASIATATSLDEQIKTLTDKHARLTLDVLSQSDAVVATGKRVFQTHCAACHRDNAQGQLHFPNLDDNDWIYGGSDEAIITSITLGRNGAMPGWDNILTPEQIKNTAIYVASLEPERSLDAGHSTIEFGQNIFMQHCSTCHGADGKGNSSIGAPNLTDDIWLHGGSLGTIEQTIKQGVDNKMPAFGAQLSSNEILAVGAFITAQRKSIVKEAEGLDTGLIEKGRYLALAGDCVACHTAQGGEPLAGGLAFVTPFGTLYSVNITPHPDEGIGDYSYQDFFAVMRKGKGKHGYLYPAMPYTSYQYVTEDDLKSIWAYLRSLTPVAQRNTANDMMFPSNIRLGMLAWDLAFLNTSPLAYPDDATESWKRGKYLVMGLGHCSECHTPRNIAQVLQTEKLFQGNLIDGWNAPNITATELYQDGWTVDNLTEFLLKGHSDKGSAFGGMADVVKNSTRYLTIEDGRAIAEYLITGDKFNIKDSSVEVLKPTGFTTAAYQQEDYKLFAQTCAACHGPDGKGREKIAPSLLNNGIIMHSDPYDTVAAILRGLSPDYLTEDADFMPMSSFDSALSDLQLAKLTTLVRKYLGGRNTTITESQITKIRESIEKSGYQVKAHTKQNGD
ncbi:MAG: cytochrome-c oxidase, cbb3-type subunit III [Gammaproteobacteria bacterium]|nr:MAG: cytochrome-c oxidase, cbb3-type subunit III [Gammaproteobacteria bacterium]